MGDGWAQVNQTGGPGRTCFFMLGCVNKYRGCRGEPGPPWGPGICMQLACPAAACFSIYTPQEMLHCLAVPTRVHAPPCLARCAGEGGRSVRSVRGGQGGGEGHPGEGAGHWEEAGGHG